MEARFDICWDAMLVGYVLGLGTWLWYIVRKRDRPFDPYWTPRLATTVTRISWWTIGVTFASGVALLLANYL